LCIYCIFLMTWVCLVVFSTKKKLLTFIVQLLLPHLARLVYYVHVDSEGDEERWSLSRVYSDEDWRLRGRYNNRILVAIRRTAPSYHYFCIVLCHPYSCLDSPRRRASPERIRLFHAVLRSRCLGCHSYPLERTFSTRLPVFLPRFVPHTNRANPY
jgi:hypothetical protein